MGLLAVRKAAPTIQPRTASQASGVVLRGELGTSRAAKALPHKPQLMPWNGPAGRNRNRGRLGSTFAGGCPTNRDKPAENGRPVAANILLHRDVYSAKCAPIMFLQAPQQPESAKGISHRLRTYRPEWSCGLDAVPADTRIDGCSGIRFVKSFKILLISKRS